MVNGNFPFYRTTLWTRNIRTAIISLPYTRRPPPRPPVRTRVFLSRQLQRYPQQMACYWKDAAKICRSTDILRLLRTAQDEVILHSRDKWAAFEKNVRTPMISRLLSYRCFHVCPHPPAFSDRWLTGIKFGNSSIKIPHIFKHSVDRIAQYESVIFSLFVGINNTKWVSVEGEIGSTARKYNYPNG